MNTHGLWLALPLPLPAAVAEVADHDAQFEYINRQARAFQAKEQPVIGDRQAAEPRAAPSVGAVEAVLDPKRLLAAPKRAPFEPRKPRYTRASARTQGTREPFTSRGEVQK